MNIVERIGKQFPEIEKKLDTLISSAGENYNASLIIGGGFIGSLVLFAIVFALFMLLPSIKSVIHDIAYELYSPYGDYLTIIIAFILALLVVLTIDFSYIAYLSFKADARKSSVEAILPDYLSLVSSNIRSGMPMDQAMWHAAKPEFGLLSKEIRQAIKESFSGKPLEKALEDLSTKFNSKLFKRIIEIIKQSIRSGGELAVVLEKTAREAREVFIVKKDIKTNLLVYSIFLVFAAAFGGPFLFAVSDKMIATLYNAFSLTENVGTSSAIGGFTVSKPPITPKDFYYFSLLTIFISIFISSLIIGSAYSGNKKDGLKYFPFMLLIAYAVFFVALGFMDMIFQNIAF